MKPLHCPHAVDVGPILRAQQDRGVLNDPVVDGTNRFHVGEVVPIELLFRAQSRTRTTWKWVTTTVADV